MDAEARRIIPEPVRRLAYSLYHATGGHTTIAGSVPLAIALKRRSQLTPRTIEFEPSDIDIFTLCPFPTLLRVLHDLELQFGIVHHEVLACPADQERRFTLVHSLDSDSDHSGDPNMAYHLAEDAVDDNYKGLDVGPYRIMRVVNLNFVWNGVAVQKPVQVVLLKAKNEVEMDEGEDEGETHNVFDLVEPVVLNFEGAVAIAEPIPEPGADMRFMNCTDFSCKVVGHFDIDIVKCFIYPSSLVDGKVKLSIFCEMIWENIKKGHFHYTCCAERNSTHDAPYRMQKYVNHGFQLRGFRFFGCFFMIEITGATFVVTPYRHYGE